MLLKLLICRTAPRLLVLQLFFSSNTLNQKYVGKKEWAIQTISVLPSAHPVLVQSRLPGLTKSSNKDADNLPHGLPPNLKTQLQTRGILNTLQPEQDFHRCSLQVVPLRHRWETVHLLFEVEEVWPQSQMIHISDWSICLACFWHILGAKIKRSHLLCPCS